MTHLTQEQRYTISSMLKQGYNKSEIARAITKDKSVVFNEIKRNSENRSGVYDDDFANRKAAKRQKGKAKSIRFIQEKIELL